MMDVAAFKITQFAVLLVFSIFISDFRKEKGITPLVSERLTLLMKTSYFVPLIAFVYVLIKLNIVLSFDIVTLGLTFIGTAIVVRAKLDLSRHHTWTGYCLHGSKFTTKGIYAYIRHPIYTGIYVFVIGGFFTVIPHASWQLSTTLAVTALFCMGIHNGFPRTTCKQRDQHAVAPTRHEIPKIQRESSSLFSTEKIQNYRDNRLE
jgi:protein-S-isoprenylcysteine O-methyltransferase Ste14